MASIEAPDIEGFAPVRAGRSLGLGYLLMRNSDGVSLCLSESGAGAADQDPAIGALLERMGVFIAGHDGYRPAKTVEAEEPADLWSVANHSKANDGYDPVFASTYQPKATPGVIIKAFDFGRRSAPPQFYLAAWLQRRLAAADNGLRAPRQLAMFESPGGHRTTVMEHMPGERLSHTLYGLRQGESSHEIREQITSRLKDITRQRVAAAAGIRGRLIVNDLRKSNILVNDTAHLALDSLAEQELTLIDQPHVNFLNLPLHTAARFAPTLRRFSPEHTSTVTQATG